MALLFNEFGVDLRLHSGLWIEAGWQVEVSGFVSEPSRERDGARKYLSIQITTGQST